MKSVGVHVFSQISIDDFTLIQRLTHWMVKLWKISHKLIMLIYSTSYIKYIHLFSSEVSAQVV